eukprot:358352-Chlamydomonas_euryale.AAC.3
MLADEEGGRIPADGSYRSQAVSCLSLSLSLSLSLPADGSYRSQAAGLREGSRAPSAGLLQTQHRVSYHTPLASAPYGASGVAASAMCSPRRADTNA